MALQGSPPRSLGGRNHMNRRYHRGQAWQKDENDKTSIPPISVQESRYLEVRLKKYKWMPTPNDAGERQRKFSLHILEKTLCQWASNLEMLRPMSENRWRRPLVTLVTFGSYRLRAYRPDADLDVLALCTPICTRGDFFTSLVKLMEAEDAISDIHPIPGAFTPVIKLSICSIQVDLLFGRVNDDAKLIQHQKQVQSLLVRQPPQGTEDNEYVIDDFDLQGLDESGVRSMNGVRVTQYLLNVVPNVEHFRVTLCAVKAWASIHGIYSNVLGFLGGINYAIMVAWVCRRYPNHYPTSLLRMFFRVFAVWEWPLPVTLAKLQCEPPTGVAWMPVWNPDTNPRDKRHLMPIITPVFPCMNSAYNTGVPQRRRIEHEMIKASGLMENGDSNWRALFQPSGFFMSYSNFLQVTIRANNAEDFMKWFRLVESRLRILICSLESEDISSWPFARFMKRAYTRTGVVVKGNQTSGTDCIQEALFYIGLKFAVGVGSSNLKLCTSDFLYNHVNSWEGRKPGMDAVLAHVIHGDLPFDLINKNLSSNQLASPTAGEATLEQERNFDDCGDDSGLLFADSDKDHIKGESGDSSNGCYRQRGMPDEASKGVTREEASSRSSPNNQRSTVPDTELIPMTRTKRPRNNPM